MFRLQAEAGVVAEVGADEAVVEEVELQGGEVERRVIHSRRFERTISVLTESEAATSIICICRER